jgi:hypothetical protein
MIGAFAALLPGYARRSQAKRMLAPLALGAMGVLIGCNLTTTPAPASPTSTYSTLQTPNRVDVLSPDALLSGDMAMATPSITTAPAPPTTPPKEPPVRSAQRDETDRKPDIQPLLPTIGPTISDQPPPPPPRAPATSTLPSPLATTVEPGLSVYTGQVTLLTYPYRDFLREERDTLYGMPVYRLDRAAYEAAAPRASSQSYQTLTIENPYLRLTFLPELGGRLYSTLVKSTGQEIFYHNPVVKPSRYGPLSPIEDNWWLGMGGMEWAFPVQEHGYAWGLPWTYDVASTPESVTVTLRDSTEPGRVRAEVQVTLLADSATFSVQPRLINGTDRTLPVQFWLSTALAPGGPSVAPNIHIILPANQVVVHSRGEAGWGLPGPRSPMPWPVVSGRDLSRYDQWANYLGFFIPYMQANFMAIYNPAADLAVARIVSPGQIPGHKFFAFGPNFGDRSYTDDNSQYVEIWGGINPGFWPEDDVQIAPGDAIEWHETWWPLAGLGEPTFANDHVAFSLLNGVALRVLGARPGQATLVLSTGGVELLREPLALNPIHPVERPIPARGDSPLQIRFIAPNGELMADYQTSLHLAGTSP